MLKPRPIAIILMLLLLLPLLLGCMISPDVSAPSPAPIATTTTAAHQPQGIQGRVLKLEGDFMPGPEPVRGQTHPVRTEVWIFSGRIPANGSVTWAVSQATQHPNFLQQVMSNEAGEFAIELPPGEYTLFARYGDHLYLNAFEGDGSYSSVQVLPGAMTAIDLVNSANATF